MCMRYLDFFFFFNDTATTEIYTLSLHDALPIYAGHREERRQWHPFEARPSQPIAERGEERGSRLSPAAVTLGPDRKSTRLNSSHANISYAVFCLKKKKHQHPNNRHIHKTHSSRV